jgi:hypothetical protein
VSLQIRTKNYFENARSLLDYIASDICVDVLGLSEKHKCYFPVYSRSEDEFVRFCKRNFPKIENRSPQIFGLLADVQPFRTTEFAALEALAKYTNENKHRDLTAQVMVNESYTASRFKVIRLGDPVAPTSPEECDGFLIADETRSDPFLGSDFVLGNIGRIIELDPNLMTYRAFKFSGSGDDAIVMLLNIQNAVTKVLERFVPALYEGLHPNL